jgi:hypothetical protein
MKKMTKLALILGCVLNCAYASAGTLTITCGKNAYEALEAKNPSKAELALVLKLRGPGAPAQIVSFQDDFGPAEAESAEYKVDDNGDIQITLTVGNYGHYEFTGIKGCGDIDTATGDVTQFKNRGGFAGVMAAGKAKCSCIKQ